MSDIFREVEEEVRRERYAQLWKKYGDYAIAGVALLVIGVAGMQLWRVYDQRQRNKASDEYIAAEQLLEAGQANSAERAFARLAKDAPGGYAAVSRLAQADALFSAGNHADAVALYRQIGAASDPYLGAVARIHAAWATVDAAPKSELENLLAPLTDPTSPWRGVAQEILAYADLRAGSMQQALKEYESLASDANSPAPLRQRARVMVVFLRAGGDRDYGSVPQPAGAQRSSASGSISPAPSTVSGGSPPK